jgi:hypothetical protein
MQAPTQRSALVIASLLALTLAGCGGGSDSSSDTAAGTTTSGGATTTTTEPTPTVVTLAGVVATGAPFTGAVVTVTDAAGAVVGTSGTVGDDGRFSAALATGARAPFVLVAERPGLNGQTDRLVSVASEGSAGSNTVNVTPVTTLVAALLSPSGDPAKLASEVSAGAVQVTPDAVAGKVTQVQALLAPLLAATNTAAVDPIKGSFAVDGTGYDRLLDSVQVHIAPASATSSNIEVAVRQQAAEGAAPTSITFTNATAAAVQLPPVDAASLVAEGTSVKIAALVNRLTACYAVPFADRVNNVTGDVAAVTGGPGDVKAPACRSLFVGDDPANYRSNGALVGRNASNGGAFAGLFRRAATGAVFSQGSYEFTRANGDLVIGYKSRDTQGNEAFDTLVVRPDADGQLRLIGNQYRYPGGVVPYHQLRQYVTLDQSAYDFRSTGYVVNVDNRTDAQGNPVFNRVEVTTPRGGTLLLKPTRGYGYLGLVKGNTTTGTNYVRLRSTFVTPTTSADLPTIEPSLFFANQTMNEDELAAVPAQSVWTYRYFLAGNTGSTPDAVQTYKTRARALTIGELKQKTLSALTDQVLASMRASANPTGGAIPLDANGTVDLGDPAQGGGWTVAAGAMPATSVSLYGSHQGSGFNDVANVGSTARTATVPCAPATAADVHCSASVPGTFAAGAVATGLHLWARDIAGREYANFYAAYKLALPTP